MDSTNSREAKTYPETLIALLLGPENGPFSAAREGGNSASHPDPGPHHTESGEMPISKRSLSL